MNLANGYTIVQWLLRFAAAIGLDWVTNSLNDYLKTYRSDEELLKKINEIHEMMLKQKFDDFTQSTVTRGDNIITYPVLRSEEGYIGQINACAPFFDIENNKVAAVIEGPAIIGLSIVAQEIFNGNGADYKASYLTASYLRPKEQTQMASGDLISGFNQPLKYKSEEADVTVDYEIVNNDLGRIHVEADNGFNKLIDRSFDIPIRRA